MTLPTSQMTTVGLTMATKRSALLGFEARVGLVDDVDPALAAHELAVAMARLQRLERASDLHDLILRSGAAARFRQERAHIRGGAREVNVAQPAGPNRRIEAT